MTSPGEGLMTSNFHFELQRETNTIALLFRGQEEPLNNAHSCLVFAG